MAERKWDPDQMEPQKSEFDATVIKAEWVKGKAFRAGEEPKDQLLLTLRPTSYAAEKDRLSWYNYSDISELRGGRQTAWYKILSAFKKLGIDLSEAPHEQLLVGKNFHWVGEIEEFEIEGAKKTSERLLPAKYNGTGILPETAGVTGAGAAADIDAFILEAAKDGISIDDLYVKLEGKATKPQTMARVKHLEKDGKVGYEDRIVSVL